MDLAGKYSVLKVRANADTPKDAAQAFAFGAEGIGLCRTEHMFFEGDRIKAIREMILADDEAGRRVALAKLLPIQRGDFEGLFKAMNGYPVTVRLLDPPLHEFVPHDEKGQKEMAAEMGVPLQKIVAKVESLAEFNPMLGHRGCRLGNTYPEITEMQARAIIEAAMNVKATGIPVHVEIMVPLVGNHKELRYQKNIIDTTAEQVFSERNDKIDYMVGTMIEVPRAAVTANQIAEVAEFFSFGTNDLTQMTLGFSRDDIGKFLPVYLEKGILKNDPFQILDRNGVGQLIREAVFKGRGTRENLKCGICGEHGGEPSSVEFCHYAGLNYVSCSPFRAPSGRHTPEVRARLSRTSFLFIKKSGSLNIFGRNREISYICFGKQFEITFIQYKKTKHEKNSFNGDRRAVRSNGSIGAGQRQLGARPAYEHLHQHG